MKLKHTQRLDDIHLAAQLLREGKLVAFATETVYGLGANALDPLAVAKIFEAKQRPHFDPLIVHLDDSTQVSNYVANLTNEAQALSEQFWPGPLTLVLPKKENIPDLVTSGLPNVAIRVPVHQQARELIAAAGVPIAAPSANLFGSVSPTTAQHVLDGLDGRIEAVLEGDSCSIGVESTVIACLPEQPPTLLRPGGLPVEEIEKVIGSVRRLAPNEQSDDSPQAGPGMLSRHYAPNKPIEIVEDIQSFKTNLKVGLLAFGESQRTDFDLIENVSNSGSLVEAAANFFASLRRLEAANIDLILAEKFPNEGLGLALNDRLRRAASK